MLGAARSAYLPPLLELRAAVAAEAALARDSLRLLGCLQEPCERADAGRPSVSLASLLSALNPYPQHHHCVSLKPDSARPTSSSRST